MNNIVIHVPHSSTYIPGEYRKTALISQIDLEEENLFMCDTGVLDIIPPILKKNSIIFPYSRLYCDVERFRDDSETMNKRGMGYIYTHDSKGREMFRYTDDHKKHVDMIYEEHHKLLDAKVCETLRACGSCILIDLHSYSDEQVRRLFGYKDCPDVCIGTEPEYYSDNLVSGIFSICRCLGLSTELNYPYAGSIVPNSFYGGKYTGLISVMLEINKKILKKKDATFI